MNILDYTAVEFRDLDKDIISHIGTEYYNPSGYALLNQYVRNVLRVTTTMYLIHDVINNNSIYPGLFEAAAYNARDFNDVYDLLGFVDSRVKSSKSPINIYYLAGTTSNVNLTALEIEHKALTAALTMTPVHGVRVRKLDDKWIIHTTEIGSVFILRLLSLLPVMLPQYDTPDLRELANCLINDDIQGWAKVCNRIIKEKWEPQAKAFMIKKLYAQAKAYTELAVLAERSKLERFKHDEEQLLNELQSIYNEIDQAKHTLFSITNQNQNPLVQALDYLTNVKGIDINSLKREGDQWIFDITVTLPLFNWDVEAAETLLDDSRYNIFNDLDPYLKQAFENILVHQTAQLWFTTRLEYNVITGRVMNVRAYNQSKGVPNPHLIFYNCWGSNKASILQATRAGNIDVALAYVVAATRSWNLHDGVVLDHVINRIINEFNDDIDEDDDDGSEYLYIGIPCVTDTDTGELLTLREYADSLKKQREG